MFGKSPFLDRVSGLALALQCEDDLVVASDVRWGSQVHDRYPLCLVLKGQFSVRSIVSCGLASPNQIVRSQKRSVLRLDRYNRCTHISNMTDDLDDLLSLLPVRLRDARRAQGLSLDAVSKLSGVSRSMVSQIERGESSPTISTLWNLTRALQVDFAGLLDAADRVGQIETLRAADVPTIHNVGAKCRIFILSPPEQAGRHEVYELVFETDGRLESKPHALGAQEHLTVVEGKLDVTSGEASSQLETGDTARYPADLPHAITARDGAARAFLVVHNS